MLRQESYRARNHLRTEEQECPRARAIDMPERSRLHGSARPLFALDGGFQKLRFQKEASLDDNLLPGSETFENRHLAIRRFANAHSTNPEMLRRGLDERHVPPIDLLQGIGRNNDG